MKLSWLFKPLKKNLLLSIVVLLSLFLAPRFASASTKEFISAKYQSSGMNVTKWSGAVWADSLQHGTDFMMGAVDFESGKFVSQGAAPKLFTLNHFYYQNKPGSTKEYLAYLGEHSGLVKKAYAQGKGWTFLSEILKFWIAMRNLAYLFFVIVFVGVGFMIMFRSKIDPQTVISIQNALPKIIVSLLLVTFSFAICSLLTDLVWLGNKIVDFTFAPTTASCVPPGGTTLLQPGSSGGVTLKWNYNCVDDPNYDLLDLIFGWGGGSTSVIGTVFTNIGSIIGGGALSSAGAGGGASSNTFDIFMEFITAFVLLSTSIKILFALGSRYIQVVVQTIFSPFLFLFGVFSPKAIGNFLKEFLASILCFPAIYAVINLSSYFAYKEPNSLIPNISLTELPPYKFSGGAVGYYTLNQLFALGLLMVIPSIPQAIEKALSAQPLLAGAGLGDLTGAMRKIPIIGQLFS